MDTSTEVHPVPSLLLFRITAVYGPCWFENEALWRHHVLFRPLQNTAWLSHANVTDAWDRVISGVCDCVCVRLCVFPRSKRKTAWAINTKLGTHIGPTLWQSLSMPGQKVRGQGHTITKTVTVARLLVKCAVKAVCCAVCMGLHVLWLLCFPVLIRVQTEIRRWCSSCVGWSALLFSSN